MFVITLAIKTGSLHLTQSRLPLENHGLCFSRSRITPGLYVNSWFLNYSLNVCNTDTVTTDLSTNAVVHTFYTMYPVTCVLISTPLIFPLNINSRNKYYSCFYFLPIYHYSPVPLLTHLNLLSELYYLDTLLFYI